MKALWFIVLTAFTVAVMLGGCATPKYCSPNPAAGNLGADVNSAFDEYAPLPRPDGTLWFSATTSEYRNGIADEAVFSTYFSDGFYENRRQISAQTFYTLQNSSYPTFYPNAYRGEYFFAARGASGKSGDVDIYYALPPYASFAPNPGSIPGINSENWDSQPAVSPDGLALIFASDRKGGKGGLDLWVCRRNSTKEPWGMPENLSVNSTYDDFTPFVAPDGELFYATESISEGKNYDIVAAKPNGSDWGSIRALPAPINTPADEISPAAVGDSIFFASNRDGGCGGYDLYAFRLCGPVSARGSVEAANNRTPLGGIIEALSDGALIRSTTVDENGRFTMPLPSRSSLMLRYRGACFPAAAEQFITTPCSENSAVSFNVHFRVPDSMVTFTFEEYNVPFFVSGYYLPNTSENLNALRLQFSYNLLGNDDFSRYIEKPGDEYDAYARVVDSALSDAAEFIADRLRLMEETPCSAGGKYLEIAVEGFADSRRILPYARYGGNDINDEEFGISVAKGANMTNELLSTLRSYNTALWLRGKLAEYPLYSEAEQKLHWFISGKGIDETTREDARKRRVGITITVADDIAKRGK
ncbi:hypothetical protein MASR2M18_02020 [Ignavibacteria bacterium]|nr:PD40 domain-containing protein [Bacteroidota bacterium]MCZ2132590.1 hypothetical protein [Bacteroidota bacterium]